MPLDKGEPAKYRQGHGSNTSFGRIRELSNAIARENNAPYRLLWRFYYAPFWLWPDGDSAKRSGWGHERLQHLDDVALWDESPIISMRTCQNTPPYVTESAVPSFASKRRRSFKACLVRPVSRSTFARPIISTVIFPTRTGFYYVLRRQRSFPCFGQLLGMVQVRGS